MSNIENRIVDIQSGGHSYAGISVPKNWSVHISSGSGLFVIVALKECPLPEFVAVNYEKFMGNGKSKFFCSSERANWREVLDRSIIFAEQAGVATILLPHTNKNGITATTKPDRWVDVLSVIQGEMEKNIEHYKRTWPDGLWVDYKKQ